MPRYRLHGTPISPYVRKVMILARLHGIELDILAPSQPSGTSGYTGGDNPLGKIPALEWSPGQWLFDSPVICEWLDAQGERPLLPGDRRGRTVQQRQHALGDGIADATYNYRYETIRPEALHWADMIARHEAALVQAVASLEAEVATLGEDWTFGNLAIVCGLDYMQYRAAHLDWRERAPALARWHEGFAGRAEWRETFAYA